MCWTAAGGGGGRGFGTKRDGAHKARRHRRDRRYNRPTFARRNISCEFLLQPPANRGRSPANRGQREQAEPPHRIRITPIPACARLPRMWARLPRMCERPPRMWSHLPRMFAHLPRLCALLPRGRAHRTPACARLPRGWARRARARGTPIRAAEGLPTGKDPHPPRFPPPSPPRRACSLLDPAFMPGRGLVLTATTRKETPNQGRLGRLARLRSTNRQIP